MQTKKLIGITLASSAAIAFACTPPSTTTFVESDAPLVKCYGVNNCRGLGSCRTAINICKGENGCRGQGFALFTESDCLDLCGSLVGPIPKNPCFQFTSVTSVHTSFASTSVLPAPTLAIPTH